MASNSNSSSYPNNLYPSGGYGGGTSQSLLGTDTTEAIKNLNKRVEEVNESLNKKQTELIEVMGIFVTLFSFISINVQIFNKISNAVDAGLFMVLIFCSLALLILLLDILLKPIIIQPVPIKIKKVTSLFYRTPLYVKYYFGQILQDIRSWATVLILIIGVSSVFFLKEKHLNKYPDDPSFIKAVEGQTNKFYTKDEMNLLLQEYKQSNKDYSMCIWYKGVSNCLK